VFDTGKFNVNSDGQTWVLANGDTTGYSMHADFQNGWDSPSILQQVVDQCDEDNGNGNMHDCPPLLPYIDEASRDACHLDPNILIPDEDVGLFHDGTISILLGNNPIWMSGQSKPINTTYVETASWGRVGSLSEGVGTRGVSPLVLDSGSGVQIDDPDGGDWELRGCIAESKTGRALEGAAIADQTEMNLRKCALACESKGYSIAGVEFGHECYCDNALRNGVQLQLLANVTCGMPCTGNPYENCGGSSAITLLAKKGVVIRTTGQASSALPLQLPIFFLFFTLTITNALTILIL
ncbi:hypothetical protein FRC16_007300, partial [Serendipita sp. 398]